MRSGDRPGLQNRRAAGHPVTGGFDPHSLPPLRLDAGEQVPLPVLLNLVFGEFPFASNRLKRIRK